MIATKMADVFRGFSGFFFVFQMAFSDGYFQRVYGPFDFCFFHLYFSEIKQVEFFYKLPVSKLLELYKHKIKDPSMKAVIFVAFRPSIQGAVK